MKHEMKVTTKAVIFNKSKDKIIAIYISQLIGWGLPGGHVKAGETPDDAIARELYEECGIRSTELKRTDFFMHSDGKLVLAYIGTLENVDLKSTQNNLEGVPKWLTKKEFMEVKTEPAYKTLVLTNWR